MFVFNKLLLLLTLLTLVWGIYASPEPHVPMSHLLKRLQYRPVRLSHVASLNFWVATPDWEKNPGYPGADWYRQAWDQGTFNGQELDDIVALIKEPCRRGEWFINLGCHLGIFSLAAAELGCRVYCVEGFGPHTQFIEVSRELNGYRHANFKIVNAVVDRERGHSLFGNNFVDDGFRPDVVPRTNLDSVVRLLHHEHPEMQPQIAMALIDVETHDQNALLGAANVLAARTIPIIKIETWCTEDYKLAIKRTAWPGFPLFAKNGYKVFTSDGKTEITDMEQYCNANAGRVGDIFAIKEEVAGMIRVVKAGRRHS